MKAKFMFSDCWGDIEIQFFRDTELEFVPIESMRFNFEPEAFELIVDVVEWNHDEGILIVGFDYPNYNSKEDFVEAVKVIIEQGEWQYQACKKGAEIIGMILKESTEP